MASTTESVDQELRNEIIKLKCKIAKSEEAVKDLENHANYMEENYYKSCQEIKKLSEILTDQSHRMEDQNLRLMDCKCGIARPLEATPEVDIDFDSKIPNDNFDDSETSIKRAIDNLRNNKDEKIDAEKDLEMTQERINDMKTKVGLTKEANIEDLERKIDEMIQMGQEANQYKEQLHREQEKSEILSQKISSLKRENKRLEVEVQRRSLQREGRKVVQRSQETMLMTDRILNRHPGTFYTSARTTLPMREALHLSVVSGPDHHTKCVKCSTLLGGSIYCQGCVDKAVYEK